MPKSEDAPLLEGFAGVDGVSGLPSASTVAPPLEEQSTCNPTLMALSGKISLVWRCMNLASTVRSLCDVHSLGRQLTPSTFVWAVILRPSGTSLASDIFAKVWHSEPISSFSH